MRKATDDSDREESEFQYGMQSYGSAESGVEPIYLYIASLVVIGSMVAMYFAVGFEAAVMLALAFLITQTAI